MDFITKNPGLQHIVEETFMNLDYENLLKCQEVNSFCEIILKSPAFWLKKCVQKGLSNEDQLEWHKLIQTLKTTNFNPEKVTSHLKEIHEKFLTFDTIEENQHIDNHCLLKAYCSNDLILMEHILESKIPKSCQITRAICSAANDCAPDMLKILVAHRFSSLMVIPC